MEANGINYYKGVLLCSRPNQSPSIDKKRQFCARVFAHDQIGIGPVKQYDQHKTKKRVLPVLNSHKKWLEGFKKDIKVQKQEQEKNKMKQMEKLEKIKQEGYEERDRQKNLSTQINSNTQPQSEQSPTKHETSNKKAQNSMKKKEKPAWAKTAVEVEQTEDKQVDQLLDFFSQEPTSEIKDYVSDTDVKSILVDLKGKIEKLKEQEDWRKDQLKRIEEKRVDSSNEGDKDDVLSRMSRQSGGQSVSSNKTAERVAQLQRKKKDTEWQKVTTSEKKTMASVDEQIAKHVADEVLRNYPHLKHHSNQSIRQLLEKQAHEQIKS